MQFSAGGPGADEEVFGKQKTLAFTLFLERQWTQTHLTEFSLLNRRQLDERPWKRTRTVSEREIHYRNNFIETNELVLKKKHEFWHQSKELTA